MPATRKPAHWARLIKKVYEVDPLECPRCGALDRVHPKDRSVDANELQPVVEELRASHFWQDEQAWQPHLMSSGYSSGVHGGGWPESSRAPAAIHASPRQRCSADSASRTSNMCRKSFRSVSGRSVANG